MTFGRCCLAGRRAHIPSIFVLSGSLARPPREIIQACSPRELSHSHRHHNCQLLLIVITTDYSDLHLSTISSLCHRLFQLGPPNRSGSRPG